MKKIFALLISVILVISNFGTCSAAKKGGSKTAYRDILDEGYVYQGNGYSMVVTRCYDGDAELFGRMWLPDGFNEAASYPTIVMCHGHSGNSDFWDKSFAPAMAKCGYICYAIDCRSANDGKRDYSTPNEDHQATVSTYARDVLAAVRFVQDKEYVDSANLYLMGQSMGSMAVQAVAAQIPEEINGVIALYGLVSESVRDLMDNYDEVISAPYAGGEVLFMIGTKDSGCTWENITQNMELYENSTAVLISGARHGYGMEDDRAAVISEGVMDDFIQRTRR